MKNIGNTVNYIVAIYGGNRRAYGEFSPIDIFIERQIEFLSKNPKYIEFITFAFNKSGHPQEKKLIEKCKNFLTNSTYEGKVIVRENKDASYGAWNDSLIETHKNTSHSFLIEDDYIPSRLDFLDFFLSKDTSGISFVSSYYHNNHAAISNGLINNEKVKKKIFETNSLFLLSGNNSYPGFFENQENFLSLIDGEITDITDIGHTLFSDLNKGNLVYTNSSLPELIKPIPLDTKGNYLVIFSAHVDNENKKNEVIETLKHLRKSNIDVCLTTHSNLYLSELSQYVKYVIYDENNEFLTLQDYIDNCSYTQDTFRYGISERKTFHDFGKVSTRAAVSPHSKSALLLIRNGLILSELNGYKWTIYLEYDIKIPNLGFKHFFDYHINRLVESGKKCFYYENGLESFASMWTGPFIFETSPVFNHEKFMKRDWYSSTKNWIKEWSLGFFESIIDHILNESFNKEEIITETIQEKYKSFWDVDTFYEIGRFSHKGDLSNGRNYLKNSFSINLYPNLNKEGNKKLFLYYYNSGDKKVNLNKFLVHRGNVLCIDKKNISVYPYNWSLIPVEVDKNLNDDVVILSWEVSIENESYSNSESIKIGDLESVYKNIMSIDFTKEE